MMHIPSATYRIQLNPSFGFADTQEILPYLSSLGVMDVYASPIFKSRQDSQHGYDVVDPNEINPQLGGDQAFETLCAQVRASGMFWLQDIVPNHMAYDKANAMLMDIFEQRERSSFFRYFDIDWVHPFESFQGRVLAPFLGGFYSDILENKEIKVVLDRDGLFVTYYELKFPLLLSTYKNVLLHDLPALEQSAGKDSPLFIKYLGMVDIFERVFQPQDARSYNQIQHAKSMLWRLYQDHEQIKELIDHNISLLNGDGDKHALEELDTLLSRQCYRLSFWKVASEELNYRRFFTINELISLRVEKKDVFEFTHKLILQLVKDQKIHGLRVDHVDGLYDPGTYLNNLREQAPETFIVAEKILALRERLPASLPIQGTTGYDFMNYLNRLFCDVTNDSRMTKIYYKFSQLTAPFEKIVQNKKRLIIGKHMAGDIDNLAQLMKKVAGHHRFGRDITLYGLKRALVEVVTFFPVYRTYINRDHMEESDKAYIEEAIKKAHDHAPVLEYEIDFIRKFLRLELVRDLGEEELCDFWRFIMKFQQLTAPIMAKGFEDTAFYTYNKLLSLNEVGGEPTVMGIEPDEFFSFLKKRAESSPHSLNATATHDTKRGEDVRARINVLSELPDEWKACVSEWKGLNKTKKRKHGNEYFPDRNDEYLIYQTLLGSFPFEGDEGGRYLGRIKDYVVKAVREAKVHTAWVKPDLKYEEACLSFVEKLLDQGQDNAFLNSFMRFQRKISFYGMYNSLSQTLIKMTAPGVPDFYQGTELWDLSLVDPDNRRPVDYEQRKKYLELMRERAKQDCAGLARELLQRKEDGRIKMFLIHQVLHLRKRHEDLFLEGELIPLETKGKHRRSVIAYARRKGSKWAVMIAPRFLTAVMVETACPLGEDIWKDTRVQLPESAPQDLTDAVTLQDHRCGKEIFLAQALTNFPGALLHN